MSIIKTIGDSIGFTTEAVCLGAGNYTFAAMYFLPHAVPVANLADAALMPFSQNCEEFGATAAELSVFLATATAHLTTSMGNLEDIERARMLTHDFALSNPELVASAVYMEAELDAMNGVDGTGIELDSLEENNAQDAPDEANDADDDGGEALQSDLISLGEGPDSGLDGGQCHPEANDAADGDGGEALQSDLIPLGEGPDSDHDGGQCHPEANDAADVDGWKALQSELTPHEESTSSHDDEHSSERNNDSDIASEHSDPTTDSGRFGDL